nr:lipopolysaccharide heptosyltransferase II [Acidithiobacillus sp. AMEEHan]
MAGICSRSRAARGRPGPGAEYGPAKRWPVDKWTRLAQALLQSGHAVWLFGSPKDAPITQEIAAQAPGAVDLGGRTTLLQAIDLLSLAPITVSNDSGLMHVAGAVGSRVIAIYGPTSLAMTPPLAENAQVLRRDLPCSPCGKRVCPSSITAAWKRSRSARCWPRYWKAPREPEA